MVDDRTTPAASADVAGARLLGVGPIPELPREGRSGAGLEFTDTARDVHFRDADLGAAGEPDAAAKRTNDHGDERYRADGRLVPRARDGSPPPALDGAAPFRYTAGDTGGTRAHRRRTDAATVPPMTDTIKLGDLEVRRLGFGAMRLPGEDAWGEPADPARARAVLARTAQLGINLIDSSWYYGPHVANRLIAEVLHPYPADLVIASKLGGQRTPDRGWAPFSRPEELRAGCEHDLRDLRRDVLDVVHLRYIGAPGTPPFLEQLDAMIGLVREGKIRHLGLSNVSAAQLAQALERTPIVSVQNLFNVGGGEGQLARMTRAMVEAPADVLAACEAHGIAFMPFFPLGAGALAKPTPALAAAATRHGATPAQIAIAWLLARSPVMLPIPGTSSPEHLEENWRAQRIMLDPDEVAAIGREAAAAAAAAE